MVGLNGLFLLVISLTLAATPPTPASDYKYIRIGNERDLSSKTAPGYALMGGGSDLEEAFPFLCDRAAGGDFLILRAAGDDDYNSYVNSLCNMNSVATLIIPSREARERTAGRRDYSASGGRVYRRR